MCSRFCCFTSTFTLGGAEWCAEFDTGGCSHICLLQGWVPLKIWGEDTYVQAWFCEFAAHCEVWRGEFDSFTVGEWFFWGWGEVKDILCLKVFLCLWPKRGNNATLTLNSSDDFKIFAILKRNPYMKDFWLHMTEPSLKYSKFKAWGGEGYSLTVCQGFCAETKKKKVLDGCDVGTCQSQ